MRTIEEVVAQPGAPPVGEVTGIFTSLHWSEELGELRPELEIERSRAGLSDQPPILSLDDQSGEDRIELRWLCPFCHLEHAVHRNLKALDVVHFQAKRL